MEQEIGYKRALLRFALTKELPYPRRALVT